MEVSGISAQQVQQQVQVSMLQQAMQGDASTVMTLLANMEQTNQALQQSAQLLGHIDVSV